MLALGNNDNHNIWTDIGFFFLSQIQRSCLRGIRYIKENRNLYQRERLWGRFCYHDAVFGCFLMRDKQLVLGSLHLKDGP